MPTESVVTVLIVAIFGNLLLMLLLLLTLAVRRRNRLMLSGGMPLSATEMRRPDPLARNTPRAGAGAGRASIVAAPPQARAGFMPHASATEPRTAGTHSGRAGSATSDVVENSPAMASADGEWLDRLTGLDGRLAWERTVREESARLDRYGRPAAVVVAEVDGLAMLAERFGPELGDRIARAVGDALRKQARASDRVARVDEGSFYVLLPETDEIAAINYVERVRAICDRWLESGAVSLRLSLGWASPSVGNDLGTALHLAHDRLNDERRQQGAALPEPASS